MYLTIFESYAYISLCRVLPDDGKHSPKHAGDLICVDNL